MKKTKKELEEKREFARLLFMQGEQQKIIADKTGVSAQTITKWVNDGGWQEQQTAADNQPPNWAGKR